MSEYETGDICVLQHATTWETTDSAHVEGFAKGDAVKLGRHYPVGTHIGVVDAVTGEKHVYWEVAEVNGKALSYRYILERDLPPVWEPVTDDEMDEVMKLLGVGP